MSGTMISDQGYTVPVTSFQLIAHAALSRGDAVAVDQTATGLNATSGLQERTAALVAGSNVSAQVIVVADADVKSGDRGWFTVQGTGVTVRVTGTVAVGSSLVAGSSNDLEEAEAQLGTGITSKVVGFATSATAGLQKLSSFDGKGGFGVWTGAA